ncbi:MAG TPA: circadian clock protein KaiB [Desulfobacterales bacterium]|nr:circadian clock protein KaiB [Desulfobacterales bacterium]
MYTIRLYVVGKTPKSVKAIEDLKAILDDEIKAQGDYSLEVVDILKNPELAEDDKILATPTAIKLLPSPLAKVIGDFSNREKVLLGLDLKGIG